jgi:phosphomannomutase
LFGAGCTVHDLGVAPTPTCGLAVRQLGAAGGIQITASHNPQPWNGLKLFRPDGRVLTADQGRQVQALFTDGPLRRVGWEALGHVTECRQAGDWHRDRVLQQVDVVRIRSRGIRALLDANGGAGGPLGRELLEALNCRPTVIGGHADGAFRHEPEPLAANLHDICPRVPGSSAAVGFVLDPDADRLALIDENGRYIGEELTLALAVQHRLRREPGPVVINMSTSRVVEDLAARFGCPCHRAAVGEANVADRMVAVGAVIGGEGNGGVLDPRIGLVRDPFIGMALVLDLMAETGQALSALADALPRYAIIKDKYPVDRDRLPQLFAALRGAWPEARVNEEDGLRLDWADRWVHVRPSNTEPIVRVIAEAPAAADAQQLCRRVGERLTTS